MFGLRSQSVTIISFSFQGTKNVDAVVDTVTAAAVDDDATNDC